MAAATDGPEERSLGNARGLQPVSKRCHRARDFTADDRDDGTETFLVGFAVPDG
jgi:hypothetical protein